MRQDYYIHNVSTFKGKNKVYYTRNKLKIREAQKSYYSCNKSKISEITGNNNAKTYAKKSLSRRESCERIELFHKLCREGPTFICAVCNRCFYQKSVRKFDRNICRDLDFEKKFSEIRNKKIKSKTFYIYIYISGHK